ncbi:YrhB domain-containing protein [Kitasatospora sp. NPDC048194]|uniref:YrhB domain-containing protein n=1 Tax=Kitasatospora sp. NPDC048194 TaxID=3364045 RepID=UPI00371D9ABB
MEIIEELLAEIKRASPEAPDLAITGIHETQVGWLVAWQSAEFKRDPRIENMLVGGGPYLVDGDDGSVYQIPALTFRAADWQALYLEQFKGARPSDPLLDAVVATLQSGGRAAAIRLLRKSAPDLSISEAKDYVLSVQESDGPPEELIRRTRRPDPCPPLPISKMRGAVA